MRSPADRLSVLALVPYPLRKAPGQRYRIEQWAPYLEGEGIDITFSPFATRGLAEVLYEPGRLGTKALEMGRSLVGRFRHVWTAKGFDAVFLHREASLIGPAWLERLVSRRNPRLVYDFDDAVWLPYVSPRNRYFAYLKAPWKTATACRLAQAVIVGNEHLADYARQYNHSVAVVPSTVSLAEYTVRPATTGGTPVIGWTGSHSSAQYLRLIAEPLRRLAQRRRFRFVVIGTERVEIPGVDVACRPWRSETEVQDLWELDVGVMPLTDDPWTRGKCAMKAIQYLAVGVPAVVSPVGANTEVIRHGENGFCAATEEEWLRLLDQLLSTPELRRRLGEAGRKTVTDSYSAEVQAPRVARILRGVATG